MGNYVPEQLSRGITLNRCFFNSFGHVAVAATASHVRILYSSSRNKLPLLAFVVFLFLSALSPSTVFGKDRLPYGGEATAQGNGPVKAWYERPTTRYDHGVLGDAIEGGSLVVLDEVGRKYELVLPETYVFEDITPRIADLDGDGQNEVVTIRTKLTAGAAIAVYQLQDGKLVEKASTQPIGAPHRWLSIAGIGDFLGDGHREIAVVKTPHIAGVLEILSLRGDKLVRLYTPQLGYSTHFIGAHFVSLAVVGQNAGDGASRLILPTQGRDRIVVLDLRKGVVVVSSHALPARLTEPLRLIEPGRVEATLETGKTLVIDLSSDGR